MSHLRPKQPSLLACLACRKKHLKCDARMPVCGRCLEHGIECLYMKSKRGYRPRKQPSGYGQDSRDAPSLDGHDEDGSDLNEPGLTAVDGGDGNVTGHHDVGQIPRWTIGSDAVSSAHRHAPSTIVTATQGADGLDVDDNLIHIFYARYHPAHPFVIPRKMYLTTTRILPDYLKAAMRLVASRFLPGTGSEALGRAARVVMLGGVPDTGFKVQALLLLAMHSFASLDFAQGNGVLAMAIDIALRIGMNRDDFPSTEPHQDPILRESWRRTWWDCFVMATLLGAIEGPQHMNRVVMAENNIPLPGPDDEYNNCQLSQRPRTLHDMRDRAFAEENDTWSSFSYKVEAALIFQSALQLGNDISANDSQADAVDAAIANFHFSLPPKKRSPVNRNGTVDEVLFAAHMIINWASVLIHRPRSTLVFIENHYPTVCTKKASLAMAGLEHEAHTAKALQAANRISGLASIRTPLANHTPCFPCAITVAATVQLPAFLVEDNLSEAQGLKERLRLALTALGSLSEVWPMAGMSKKQLGQFARDTFAKPLMAASHQPPPAILEMPPNSSSSSSTSIYPTLEYQQAHYSTAPLQPSLTPPPLENTIYFTHDTMPSIPIPQGVGEDEDETAWLTNLINASSNSTFMPGLPANTNANHGTF